MSTMSTPQAFADLCPDVRDTPIGKGIPQVTPKPTYYSPTKHSPPFTRDHNPTNFVLDLLDTSATVNPNLQKTNPPLIASSSTVGMENTTSVESSPSRKLHEVFQQAGAQMDRTN